MTITVGTNSYVSIADADAYFVARGNSSWGAATDDAKGVALIKATQYMDAVYTWVGIIENTTQALGWPRGFAFDREGRTLTGIPVKVQEACCELAYVALTEELLVAETAPVKRKKAGAVEIEYAHGSSNNKTYPLVNSLLMGLGSRSGGVNVKLLRG